MSSVSSNDSSTSNGEKLVITSWPLRQEPARSAAILLVVLAVAAYALLATASWLTGIATLLALLASVWRLWVPVHIELGPRGVIQRVGRRDRRIPWREISGYQLRGRGAFLFMDDRPGPLAMLRSLFIRYPTRPEQLRELLEFYVAPRRGDVVVDDVTTRTVAVRLEPTSSIAPPRGGGE